MSSLLLAKIKNYINQQIAYGKLLLDTSIEPIRNVYEVKESAMINKDDLQLEEDIKQLAYHKALNLGFDPTSFDNLECLIWEIQKREGCQLCFRNKDVCTEARCCWMKLCFKEE